MNDITNATASEDAMELVFTIISIAPIAALAQTMEFPPVVPASWFLTNIPTYRALVSKLWARHLRGSLCESWITLLNHFMIGHLGEGGECTDPQPTLLSYSNSPQIIELSKTHDFFGNQDIIMKTAQ